MGKIVGGKTGERHVGDLIFVKNSSFES